MIDTSGIITQTGQKVFDQVIHNAQIRKYKDEKVNEWKDFFRDSESKKNSSAFERIKGMNEGAHKPQPSNQLTKEGLMKIMLEKSKPSSLEKKDDSESANMMVAIANMDASTKFVKSIEELMDVNQLISAVELEGKEVEAYRPLNEEEEKKYRDTPDDKPTIKGIVVDSSKHGDKRYLHLALNPGAPKDKLEIVKVEFKDLKKSVLNSTLGKENKYQGLSGAKELEKLYDLKGQTIKAYTPFELPLSHYHLKNYIDLKDRPIIDVKVVDVIRDKNKDTGKDDYYLKAKKGEEIFNIKPEDVLELVGFEKENPFEKMLFQNQLSEALKLKGQKVSMISDPIKQTIVTGEVEKISTENNNIFLTLKQGDEVFKIDLKNLKEV